MKRTEFEKNKEWFVANSPQLQSFQHLWSAQSSNPLRWDQMRKVFSTGNARRTYQELFGSWPIFREFHSVRFTFGRLKQMLSLQRWINSELTIPLPTDAVVWFKWDGAVTFIASASDKRIVKLVRGDWFKRHMIAESKAWNRVRDAGLTKHVPAIYEQGEIGEDGYWICMELVPNTPPVFPRDNTWNSQLESKLLPFLEKYYEQAGIERLTPEEWETHLRSDAARLGVSTELDPLITRLSDMPRVDASILRSIVHGDLKPENVHHHQGNWWLFDWSSDRQTMVMWDCFAMSFYRYIKEPRSAEGSAFWSWLSSTTVLPIPGTLTDIIRVWCDWQNRWMGNHNSVAITRYQLYSMCLEWYLSRIDLGASDFGILKLLTQEEPMLASTADSRDP